MLIGSLVSAAWTAGAEPYASSCQVYPLDSSCTTCFIVSPCASARKRNQPVRFCGTPALVDAAKPRSPNDPLCSPNFEYHLQALSPAVLKRNFRTPSTHTAVCALVNARTRDGAGAVRRADVGL